MAGAGFHLLGEVVDGSELRVVSSLDSQGHCVLSNLTEVVERVLSFLPIKPLLTASCVCRLWRDCAQRNLKTRQRITWVSYTEDTEDDLPFFSHPLVNVVKSELEKINVLPHIFLYITDYQSLNNFGDYETSKSDKRNIVWEIASEFEKLLPKECDILGLNAMGIIATPMGSGSNRPLELENERSGFGLIIPKMNGVKVRTFNFINDPFFDERILQQVGLRNNPDLKVVLMFEHPNCTRAEIRYLRQVIDPLIDQNVIIVGGQVEILAPLFAEIKAKNSAKSLTPIGAGGLTFSGPLIQAASVVLDLDVDKVEAADSIIRRLKAMNIPEENSIGFMIAFHWRGKQHYGKDNVEADLFRKHFPSMPLFGFFGKGEVGTYNLVRGNFRSEFFETRHEVWHCYTTVMLIIHFGS